MSIAPGSPAYVRPALAISSQRHFQPGHDRCPSKRFGQLLNLSADFLSLSPPSSLPPSPVPRSASSPTYDDIDSDSHSITHHGGGTSASTTSTPTSSPSLASPTLSAEDDDNISVSEFPLPPCSPPGFLAPGDATLQEVRALGAFWRGFGGGRDALDAALQRELFDVGAKRVAPGAYGAEALARWNADSDFSWEAEEHAPAHESDVSCEDVGSVLDDLGTSDSGILDALVELSMSLHTVAQPESPVVEDFDEAQDPHEPSFDQVFGLALGGPEHAPLAARREPIAPSAYDVSSEWVHVGDTSSASTASSPSLASFRRRSVKLLQRRPAPPPVPAAPRTPTSASRSASPAPSRLAPSLLAPSLSMPDLKNKARALRRKTSHLFGGAARRGERESTALPPPPVPPLPRVPTPPPAEQGAARDMERTGHKDLRRVLGSPAQDRGEVPAGGEAVDAEDASFALDRFELSIAKLEVAASPSLSAASMSPAAPQESPSKRAARTLLAISPPASPTKHGMAPPPAAGFKLAPAPPGTSRAKRGSMLGAPHGGDMPLRAKKSLPTMPWATYQAPPPPLPSMPTPPRSAPLPNPPSSSALGTPAPSWPMLPPGPTAHLAPPPSEPYTAPRAVPPPQAYHGRSVSTSAPPYPDAAAALTRMRRTGSDAGPARPRARTLVDADADMEPARARERSRDLLRRAVGRAGMVSWWKGQRAGDAPEEPGVPTAR